MVMNIENNLRLHLEFLKELDQVKVLAGTNDWDQQLAFMGVVKGKEQLVDLLNVAGIDHHIVGGDIGTIPPSSPVAYDKTPQEMVKSLDEAFRTVDEAQLNILDRLQLTAEESTVRKPVSLHVYSSTTTVSKGLPRVQKWFENHARKN
jgi:hypothetical protein